VTRDAPRQRLGAHQVQDLLQIAAVGAVKVASFGRQLAPAGGRSWNGPLAPSPSSILPDLMLDPPEVPGGDGGTAAAIMAMSRRDLQLGLGLDRLRAARSASQGKGMMLMTLVQEGNAVRP
jgi:hypothetical protein